MFNKLYVIVKSIDIHIFLIREIRLLIIRLIRPKPTLVSHDSLEVTAFMDASALNLLHY